MEKKKIKLKTRFLVSIVLGILAFIIGFRISWINPYGDAPEKIKKIEQEIEKLCSDIGKVVDVNSKTDAKTDVRLSDIPGAVLIACSWRDLEKITEPLVYENAQIAKAKALTYCQANPIPKYSGDDYLWNDRYEVSNREWKIQTFGSRVLVGLGTAVLSCVETAVGIFLILTIIPWLWYFLLERIIELSRSIQGK